MKLYQTIKIKFTNHSNNPIMGSLKMVDNIDANMNTNNEKYVWLCRDKNIPDFETFELCEFMTEYKPSNKLTFIFYSNFDEPLIKMLNHSINLNNEYKSVVKIFIDYQDYNVNKEKLRIGDHIYVE